jgi:hypothetical protein
MHTTKRAKRTKKSNKSVACNTTIEKPPLMGTHNLPRTILSYLRTMPSTRERRENADIARYNKQTQT